MSTTQSDNTWKKCSTCKKSILFRQKYYICSVSTCSSQRTGYSFCSIHCFEAHLPGAKHRDAGAIEKIAPSVIINNTAGLNNQTSSIRNASSAPTDKDILIVASKLKDYIRNKSEMNTSASVMDILSDMVRSACDMAIESARQDGRKTVLDRDFKIKL